MLDFSEFRQQYVIYPNCDQIIRTFELDSGNTRAT